jgi:hypothetical protein
MFRAWLVQLLYSRTVAVVWSLLGRNVRGYGVQPDFVTF